MILGLRGNINNDTHRIFLTRLVNNGTRVSGIKSLINHEEYSFVFASTEDFNFGRKLADSMRKRYTDVPVI